MVLLCLLSALLSYKVKKIIENCIDTNAKALGNTIELKMKKKSTKSIKTGALMVLLCLLSALLSYKVKKIFENCIDTNAKAVGNAIELKMKKKAQNE